MRSLLVPLVALLLVSLPPALAESRTAWTKADGADDVVVDTGSSPPVQMTANPVSRHVDLTQLRLEDPNEAFLLVHLKNAAGFREVPPTQGPVSWNLFGRVSVVLGLPASEAARTFAIVEASLAVNGLKAEDARVERAELCLTTAATLSRCDYNMVSYPIEFQIKDGELTVEIPKRYLAKHAIKADRFRAAPPLPDRLPAGSELSAIVAHSSVSFGGRLYDRMPDTGEGFRYSLDRPGPATDLHIVPEAYAVIAGEATFLDLRFTNNGSAKRLLNLSVVTERGEWPAGWSATMVPSLVVAAGRSANTSLKVVAPANAAGTLLRLLVYARATNDPGTVGVAPLPLRAVPALDRGASTWYAHADYPSTPLLPAGPLFSTPIGYGFTSRVKEDPAAKDQARIRWDSSSTGSGGSTVEWRLDRSLDAIPNAARIVEGPATFTLATQASRDLTVDVLVQVFAGAREVARHQSQQNIRAGPVETVLPLTVLKSATRVGPEDGLVRAFVQARLPSLGLLTFTNYEDLMLVPQKTSFTLPLEREAEPIRQSARRLITLSAAEDLDGFVNPGRQRVAELDVRNGDPQPARLRLTVANVSAGWTVRVLPGETVRLGSNESLRVGLLIRAGASLGEGSALAARLEVADLEGDEVVASALVRATVTQAAEFPNETFEASQEDAKKVEVPGKGSPGPGLVGLLVVAAVGSLWARRRHGGHQKL